MTDRSLLSRVQAGISRNRLRIAFVAVLLLSAAALAAAASDSLSTASEDELPNAPETDNHTVITESGRVGTITAYAPDGEVLYYNNTRTKYFDVDPVEADPLTVEYAATDTIHSEGPTCSDPPCARNVLERADLETGEVEVLYDRYDYKEHAGEWHDADRINESHVLIADIVADQVFIVNTETEIVEWLWDAQSDFPVEGGGPYPDDWAHINDVEYIEEGTHDGHVMVSLRNQDQVVFIDPDEGLLEEWTLGTEDDYDVMYEQHNPDYVPESRGGPAVVVSDSENGRVEEFQREDGEWTRSWEWADDRLQWPRDADRLPNGNTLVTDTHGNRVMELDADGEIVWQVASTLPYEAERLETGDESAGGHSAQELDLESRTTDGATADGFDVLAVGSDVVEAVVPNRIHNGILFATPVWMGRLEFAVAGVALLTGLVWVGLEIKWHLGDAGIGFRLPVYRRGDE
ncbi:arylsulfotransferase family protein [Halopiger djelfimassiliensis]|uniref:arylsulfotransferase family protein n=1 Tax=Halopiger djelfimassiliensis TaxID=1293047 RepID=UPI0006776DC4|nr:arylsulfotransferase family protein [Halopiger djelfimassiliensis]